MTTTDGVEKVIGRFGKYQALLVVIITIGRLPTEYQLNNVVFILPSVDYVCLDDGAFNQTNFCPCANPLYDQSTIVSSVTSEFNLICGRTSLASLAQAMMQVGVLAGSLVFGYVSDRFGRKTAILLSLFLEAAFVTGSAFITEFWMFVVCRVLIGMAIGGTMLCCFVLLIEVSGTTFRNTLTALQESSFIIGYFSLGIIAYYIKEWRTLQLVTSVPWIFITMIMFWLIPESPRWMITVGKKKQAVATLTKIAMRNKLPTDNVDAVVNETEKEASEREQHQYGTYLDLFKTAKIRRYAFTVALVWMCCAHTFFGVNQYIGRLQGNIYLNVMLSALCLIPGLIIFVVGSKYVSRKVGTIISFVIAALSLLVFLVIPNSQPQAVLAFALIGQTGIYISFCQVYLYTSEVFPTVVRNSAMGFASVFARFGGFIAPFVVNIGVEWASIVVFSSLSFLAAILCYLLPETKNTALTNTIDETENINKNNVLVEQ